MFLAALLIFVLILVALGLLVGRFLGGRGISLLGLLIGLGLGWLSSRLTSRVRAGELHPDDGLVVYVYLAVFVVTVLVFAGCYVVLSAKGKLPRQRLWV